MNVPILYQVVTALVTAAACVIYRHIRYSCTPKLPPSPWGLPILGHALKIPRHHIGTYFRTLIRAYGPLVSLNLAGTPVLLIGNSQLAHDILDKRSSKFSSRPNVLYIERYFDPDGSYWAFHGQTEAFYTGRKLTAAVMSSVRAGMTEPLHRFETLLTVQQLLTNGDDAMNLIKRMIGSTVLAAAFGVHCPTGKEYELVEATLTGFQGPCLGEHAQRSSTNDMMSSTPRLSLMQFPENALKYTHVWTSEFASGETHEGDHSRFMAQFAGASIETTTSTVASFILAALVYPEWVLIAQKELDDVVGADRLPTFSDRESLPYIEAILRETLRWRPPGRSGIPHMSTEDDIVECHAKQYFVPAGTYVFAVAWAIEHDPEIYDEPERFDPQRHLDGSGKLRTDYVTSTFGHGRRVCPGSPFAERALWISIAMLLWTFKIEKSKIPDAVTGLPFPVRVMQHSVYDTSDAAFGGDLANGPRNFPVVFVPRSARHAEVAKLEWEDCEKDLRVLLPKSK